MSALRDSRLVPAQAPVDDAVGNVNDKRRPGRGIKVSRDRGGFLVRSSERWDQNPGSEVLRSQPSVADPILQQRMRDPAFSGVGGERDDDASRIDHRRERSRKLVALDECFRSIEQVIENRVELERVWRNTE